jgi:tetratricopeptide (TPR) repeat protein
LQHEQQAVTLRETSRQMSQRAIERVPLFSSEPHRRRVAINVCLCVALAAITSAVYAPVRHYAFLNYDDPQYVTDQPLVQAGLTREGLIWAWTGEHVGNWHPLTTLSHMLDCQLFGFNPGPPHVINVALHVLSTVLLFGVLVRATARPWPSAVVAALFALHPLHVESVAWIAERKDVLSGFFWMLTLWAYLDYVGCACIRHYAILLAAYAAALLAKPMVVTLPFVLLLLDYWPLRRGTLPEKVDLVGVTSRPPLRALLLEKLPLLAMAAAVSVVTYLVQQNSEAVISLSLSPFSDRLANVLKSYVVYPLTMLWPAGLAVFYPFDAPLPAWQIVGSIVVLASVTAAVAWKGRVHPYLPVGWLWYVGTLIPVIGLVRAGLQARADRFTYVPSIGIFIMAAWGLPDLAAPWRHRQLICGVAAALVIAACATLTTFQLEHWRDGIALFQHALSVTRDNEIARRGLAGAYLGAGLHDEWARQVAEIKRVHLISEAADYRRILSRNPDDADAHYQLGRVLATQGDLSGAMAQYAAAIRPSPAAAPAHSNLGALLIAAGRPAEGLAHLEEAVRLQPDYADAHFNLGTALLNAERLDAAEPHLRAALQLQPDYAEAHSNLGVLLLKRGRTAEAIAECVAALHERDDFPEAHTNLGMALAAEGRFPEAIAHYETAVRLKPDHAAAHRALGLALAHTGDHGRAATELEAAVRLDPADTDSRALLQWLQHDRRDADPK